MTEPWIAERLTGVPRALADALESVTEDLVEASHEALETAEALVHGREGAEPLLAADALITYACQRALDADRPNDVWTQLIERIGQEPE